MVAPDNRPGVTRRYLESAARDARSLDPTLPISVDINGRPYHPEQFTYHSFDMLGINQYFGWYSWVSDFNLLPLFLQEMRDLYPRHALVMTEFGPRRGRSWPAPVDHKGSYAFQSFHLDRTLAVADAAPISGAIYWTLREFEIFPAGPAAPGAGPPVPAEHAASEGPAHLRGRPQARLVRGARRFRATQLYR